LRPPLRPDTLRQSAGGPLTDQFSFFFAFYGLILGVTADRFPGSALQRH